MKKVLRYLLYMFLFLISTIIIWSLFHQDLVSYGWAQFRGQMHIVRNARPMEEVLRDRNFPDSLKKKIIYINVVADFAADSLGLKRSKNYTTLYDQKNKPLLWVITASDKFKLN